MTTKEFREMYSEDLKEENFYKQIEIEISDQIKSKTIEANNNRSTPLTNKEIHIEIKIPLWLNAFLKYPGKFIYKHDSFATCETYYNVISKKKCLEVKNLSNNYFENMSHIKMFPKTNIITHSMETEIKLVSKILGIPYAREVL